MIILNSFAYPKLAVFMGMNLCSLSVGSCDGLRESEYVIHAKAMHQDGTGVPSAKVRSLCVKSDGGFLGEIVPTEVVETNDAGEVVLKFSSLPTPEGVVSFGKAGYYGSTAVAVWEKDDSEVWSANVEALLSPVRKPVAMFAYSNIGAMEKIAKIPELNKRYGFDLMLAEPLPPLGKGKHADFLFWIEGRHDRVESYDLRLHVEFQNPDDGVVEFLTPQRRGVREPTMHGSQLISDYVAPEDGYVPRLTRVAARTSLDKLPLQDEDFHRNFYFRTRTEVDSSGRIISAHYGKIYGDFHFSGSNSEWGYLATLSLITTYFNPTPNDRNVEFDPKRNLHPEGNVDRP